MFKLTEKGTHFKAKEILLRASTDTYATPVWLAKRGMISNEGKCPSCRVPTTIMHLTHECIFTKVIQEETERKIRTMLHKQQIKSSSKFWKSLMHRSPNDDSLVHELGFIPKQEYNGLDKQQKKVVDIYHTYKIEQMIATWQTLWAKKTEFHEAYPDNPPNLKRDDPPEKDPETPTLFGWTAKEIEEIEQVETQRKMPQMAHKITKNNKKHELPTPPEELETNTNKIIRYTTVKYYI